MSSSNKIGQTLLLAVVLVAATIAAYQSVWQAGYIFGDDRLINPNEWLIGADGFKRIWFSIGASGQYSPLSASLLRLEHALWGARPAGYHWINLALHIANALVLWRLLHLLRLAGAWLGAALFALHPVQVESVAWISQQRNLVMGFFFLLTLLAWRKFVAGEKRGDWKYYAAALFCHLLALACSALACTLPFALLLMLWLKRGSIRAFRFAQVLPFLLLGLGTGAWALWAGRLHQLASGNVATLGMMERSLVAVRAFWFYLGKIFWPRALVFNYPRWTVVTGHGTDFIWMGALLLLVVVILAARRWVGRGPETALLFFAVVLAPVLGFITLTTFRYTFVADHFQYLACIGPLALVAAVIGVIANRLGRAGRVVAPLLAAALLLPLSYRTWQQSAIYQNEETLWRATLAANRASWLAQENLAKLLMRTNRAEEAIGHYEEALRLEPNFADTHYDLGRALAQVGRGDEAQRQYERALELDPNNAGAHTDLGIRLWQRHQEELAMEQWRTAIGLAPKEAAPRRELGRALISRGRLEEALVQLRAALELSSDDLETRAQLAVAYARMGNRSAAEEQTKVLRQQANLSPTVQADLGQALLALDRPEEAVEHLQETVQQEPENAEAEHLLGVAAADHRDLEEAARHFRRALQINPGFVSARLNLANALMESGQTDEALVEYQQVVARAPNYALGHQNLASALNVLGRYDEAMEQMKIVWRLQDEAGRAPAPPRPTP